MDMTLLFISAAFAVTNNCLLHTLSAKNIRYNPFFFNAVISLWWIPILLCLNGGFQAPAASTVAFGLLYGLCTAVFLFIKTFAMTNGPIAATTLIGSCSFIITTVFNAIYWRETVTVYRVVGAVLIVVAAVLVTGGGKPGDAKPTKRWICFVLAFFVLAGVIGIVFRFFQSSPGAAQINEMMIIAAAVSSLLLFTVYFCSRKPGEGKPISGPLSIFIMLAGGVAALGYNRLNIYLSGAMESSLFFPLLNGVVLLATAICGVIFFGEKLRARKACGIALGVVAIIIISEFFGLAPQLG